MDLGAIAAVGLWLVGLVATWLVFRWVESNRGRPASVRHRLATKTHVVVEVDSTEASVVREPADLGVTAVDLPVRQVVGYRCTVCGQTWDAPQPLAGKIFHTSPTGEVCSAMAVYPVYADEKKGEEHGDGVQGGAG